MPVAGIDWRECTKKNLMLQGSDFQGANLADADLSLTNLSGTNLSSANFEKALYWYGRSAKQGNVDAMLGLAGMCGHGQGMKHDKAAAYRWLVLASSQHLDEKSATIVAGARDDLAKHLTSEQIQSALAEARSFVPKPE